MDNWDIRGCHICPRFMSLIVTVLSHLHAQQLEYSYIFLTIIKNKVQKLNFDVCFTISKFKAENYHFKKPLKMNFPYPKKKIFRLDFIWFPCTCHLASSFYRLLKNINFKQIWRLVSKISHILILIRILTLYYKLVCNLNPGQQKAMTP